MPVEILMPELGESVHEATVTRWIVKEGDFVKEDDPVVEIMTDKVNTELPSPASGILSKILVPEGGSVRVFEPMGVIEEKAEVRRSKAEGGEEREKREEEREKQPEAASADESKIQNPESEIPSAFDPRPSSEGDGKHWFTPVVRSIAKQHGISDAELAVLKGTGTGGRVTKKDVEAYIASGKVGAVTLPPAPTFADMPPPAASAGPEQEVVQLTSFRKMLADAMLRANAVPTVSTCIQVDMTAMVKFREANKDAFQAQNGVKLTYTSFFIKALTESLLEFPGVNSSLEGDRLTIHRAVHMGVAVALGPKGDEGLIVPVIRDCHKKNLVELAKELEAIAAKTRTNTLKPADVQGGTFTLTNPGSYGALFGTPMIVAPQAGIAGAYGIQKMPVVVGDDMIAIRQMMYMVLTYDHRVVDGLLAGRFLQSVKKKLEGSEFFK